MDIQGRIRELMEERSWTEYRLAKEANLSHSTVANMFNRNNTPTFPTREFDTLKSKKVPQSLEIGLFFCQIFIFII